MQGAFKILAVFALAVLAFVASPAARAEMAPLSTCIAPIPAGEATESVIAKAQAFECGTKQSALGAGDFLVRLTFPKAVSQISDPLVLRMSSVWQQSAKVHFRYADGSQAQFAFSSQDIGKVLTIGAIFEVPVPVRAAPLETAYVESRGAGNLRGVVLGPKLMTRSQSYDQRTQITILYAAFAGLALALVVYNLSLWTSMRHSFQLYYCGMVGGLMAYAFTSSGLMGLVFPGLDNTLRLRWNYAFLALTAAMALQFVRHFFGDETVGAKINRAIRIATVFASLAVAGLVVFAPWQIWFFDRAYFAAILAMLCLVPLMLIQAWRARSPYLKLVLLAWSAPLITSFMRSMHGFSLFGYSFWLDNSNLIALSVEALLSSILVTARLRELSHERDHALAGEQVAKRLAAMDPLTGLLNRRAFLDMAIGRKAQQRLLLIDIDHFKTVNDRLGHAGGDDVLRAVAEAIQGCRPSRSLAVRLGGEEFALLLPRGSFSDCTPEMVLDAVRSRAMPQGVQVTVSLGYADGIVASEDDWKRLYRLADAALYRAKSDGRDRACRATDFRAVA